MTSMDVQISQRGVITIPKSLRESYGLEPGDTLTPHRSEIDAIADKIAEQWAEDGQTLGSMLQGLR